MTTSNNILQFVKNTTKKTEKIVSEEPQDMTDDKSVNDVSVVLEYIMPELVDMLEDMGYKVIEEDEYMTGLMFVSEAITALMFQYNKEYHPLQSYANAHRFYIDAVLGDDVECQCPKCQAKREAAAVANDSEQPE